MGGAGAGVAGALGALLKTFVLISHLDVDHDFGNLLVSTYDTAIIMPDYTKEQTVANCQISGQCELKKYRFNFKGMKKNP